MARFISQPMKGRQRAGWEAELPLYVAAEAQQKKQPKKGGDDEGDAKEDGVQKLAKKGDELKEEMDSLMDEIDSVLEENAEEFVKNYVQRGGE